MSSLPDNQPQSAAASSPQTAKEFRILLALSGGGFRATIFNLGVLRAFRDAKLLPHIKAISSVSGGSITATHLVLNWHEYRNYTADHVSDLEKTIRQLTKNGIRNQIVDAVTPYQLVCTDAATQLLISRYEQLWPEKKLNSLESDKDTPQLFIMAANLSRHTGYTYFTSRSYIIFEEGKPRRDIKMPTTSLATAVAASSAYPALFPPVKLEFDSVKEAESAADYLTDGGVFENLGITVLKEFATANPFAAGGETFIISSNAGKTIDWDMKTDFSAGLPRGLLRGLEVMQFWGERRLVENAGEIIRQVNIQNRIEPGWGQWSNCSTDVQDAIAKIRTDLDEFNDSEFRALFDHGYSLATQLIESNAVLGSCGKADRRHNPWSQEIDIKMLRSETKLEIPPRWKSQLQRIIVSVALICAAVAVALIAISGIASYRYGKKIGAQEDWGIRVDLQNRMEDLEEQKSQLLKELADEKSKQVRGGLKFTEPEIVLDCKIARFSERIFPKVDENDRTAASKAARLNIWQWITDHLTAEAEAVSSDQVVYELSQVAAFKHSYESFKVRLVPATGGRKIKIIDGVVCIRDSKSRFRTYHPFKKGEFPRDEDGMIESPEFEIEMPDAGEFVWLIVTVEGKGLPTDPSSIGPWLKLIKVDSNEKSDDKD